MARARRRKSLPVGLDDEFPDSRPPRRRQRRRFPWVIGFLLVVAAVVFFAPQMVAHPTVRNHLVKWVVPRDKGQLQLGEVSAGWLAPIVLTDVALLDANNEPVLRAAEIRSERRLIDLVKDYRQLGTLFIEQPHVQLVLTENGSNLSDLLQAISPSAPEADSSSTTSSPSGFTLQIAGGQIDVFDRVTQSECSARNLDLTLEVPAGNESPLRLDLATDTVQSGMQGRLKANVWWELPEEISGSNLGRGQVVLQSTQFPLPIAAALTARSAPDMRLHGRLDTDLTCDWTSADGHPKLTARGLVDVRSARLAMASVLGTDEIRAESINAQLDAAVDHERLVIQQCDTSSDLGQLHVRGQLPLAELLSGNWQAALFSDQSTHQLQADGTIDVAQLATMLPQTLRIRPGTTLSEGRLSLECSSQRENNQRVLRADVTTTSLSGTADGAPVRWDEPVQIQLIARPTDGQLTIDRLEATASFLNVVAEGDLLGGRFDAQGDLGSMRDELGKFSDFGSLQLVGNLQSKGSWNIGDDGRTTAQATAHISDFGLAYGELAPVREPSIRLIAKLAGLMEGQTLKNLDSASFQMVSDNDQLVIQLDQPVSAPSSQTQWPIRLQMQGRTESWLARLQPWISTGGWHMSGDLMARARGSASTTKVALQPVEIELGQLQATSGPQKIVEAMVKLNGQASWDQASQRLIIPTATISSSTLALAAKDIDVSLDPATFQATGATSYRADLQRLWTLTADPNALPTIVPQGQVTGTVQLATVDSRVRFTGETTVANLVISTFSQATPTTPAGWNQTWQEPEVRVQASGIYDQPADRVQFDQLAVHSETAQLDAVGTLDRLSSDRLADLHGNVTYDWQKVLTKLRSRVGSSIRLSGRQQQPFTIRGPLSSPSVVSQAGVGGMPNQLAAAAPLVPTDLTAEASLSWDQATAMGITVGPQQIDARLERSQVLFQPLTLALQTDFQQQAGASITMAPRIDLTTPNPLLLLDQTTSVRDVELTPQLCDSWLKYVNPLLAGAATASGRVSAYVVGARVPLTNPVAADLAATIAIDHARVSPGPMAQQLLSVSQQVGSILQKDPSKLSFLQADKTWLEMNQQQVEVQMSGGRVYHRNLEMTLGDATVRSHGWVSVDQSLSVVAEIPILDKWIEGEKLLAGMRGKSVQLPIHGTFSQPRIDQRALAQLSSQLIGSTAEQFIQDELQKGLQKLLGPK